MVFGDPRLVEPGLLRGDSRVHGSGEYLTVIARLELCRQQEDAQLHRVLLVEFPRIPPRLGVAGPQRTQRSNVFEGNPSRVIVFRSPRQRLRTYSVRVP